MEQILWQHQKILWVIHLAHNLAWLYFSENDVFGRSAYVIHWDFAMLSLIVEPAQ